LLTIYNYGCCSYEFDDVFDEKEFDNIFPDEIIIKIEHITLDDNYEKFGFKKMLDQKNNVLMKLIL